MGQPTHRTHRNHSANSHNALRRSAVKGTSFFNITTEQLSFSRNPGVPVQPKLTVNAPYDIYEKEADPSADGENVMGMPEPQIHRE